MRQSATQRPRDRKRVHPSSQGDGSDGFVADAMHGSLARKLRALGIDTAYYRSGDDEGLIRFAKDSSRVVLTSDRALSARLISRGLPSVLLEGTSDGARLREIADSGVTISRGEPLCSICGGGLERVTKEEAARSVPMSVLQRHRVFLHCRSCGQTYWKGTHWEKLMSLGRQLKKE